MANINWGQAVGQVRFALNQRSVADLPDDKIKEWLVQSIIHICNPEVHMHPLLYSQGDITLATGVSNYYFSHVGDNTTSAYVVLGVRYIGSGQYALQPQSEWWFRQRDWSLEGRPSHYLHTSRYSLPFGAEPDRPENVLRIYHAPSAEYNGESLMVYFYRKPPVDAASIADDESPRIQDLWDEPWVLGAIWRGWRDLNQPVFADRSRDDFAAMVNEIKERFHQEMREDPREFYLEGRSRNRVQRFRA